MKSAGRVFCLSVVCSWLCLAAPFAAAERGHRWADSRDLRERGQQERAGDQGFDRRAFEQGEARPDQRNERLSPEDRLQLRRDVRDAGRDIYPERSRRHGFRRH
ncbi:MAG: hypothetical protein HZB64_01750 [Rhodocyclales bacterium]|nr:hypothetical protein [Rhodocyclales bacterium]